MRIMKVAIVRIVNGEDISPAAMLIRLIVVFSLLALLLFASAGTLLWPEAWLLLLLQLMMSVRMIVWLYRHDPALLKSRMSYLKPGIRLRDQLFALLFTSIFLPLLILPGVDVVRFGWSAMPVLLEGVGFVLYGVAQLLVFRVLQQNSFASPIVEIQPERGHLVVESGVYAHVRHPMYTGFIGCMLAFPLALGSWWSIPLAMLLAATFLIRIFFEEQTLRSELPGYAGYCERVRYRLVPGVW